MCGKKLRDRIGCEMNRIRLLNRMWGYWVNVGLLS